GGRGVLVALIYLAVAAAGIIYLLQLAAFIVVALVLSLPAARFRVVPKRRLWGQAHAEAIHQFLAHGIHLTEHRTGVLIFASVAERYSQIVADSGNNAKGQPEAWAKAIAAMIFAVKGGRTRGGCVGARRVCGCGGRLRGRRRVVRCGTGAALPARRVRPRRIAEQGGRDLKRTLQLGFSFLGGAALLAASSLGLAMAQVNCETFPAGPARTDSKQLRLDSIELTI